MLKIYQGRCCYHFFLSYSFLLLYCFCFPFLFYTGFYFLVNVTSDELDTFNYTPSEAWSGVNWADLMAAQGALGTDFYETSTRTIVDTMLWTEYRPVIKIGPKGALGSPIYSAPSLGQSIAGQFSQLICLWLIRGTSSDVGCEHLKTVPFRKLSCQGYGKLIENIVNVKWSIRALIPSYNEI